VIIESKVQVPAKANLLPAGNIPGLKVSRRSLISWLVVGWVSMGAATSTMSAAVVRFMFPNVLFEPNQTFKAGFPNEIRVGDVDERFKASERVWLGRDQKGIYALLAICTHLALHTELVQ